MTESDDPLRALWQSGPEPELPLTLADLTERDRAMNQAIRRRNLVETAAGLGLVALFAALAGWIPGTDLQIGWGLIVVGLAVLLGVLWTRGAPSPVDPTLELERFTEAHVAHLRREARLLRAVPLWYVGPLVPGILWVEAAVFLRAGPALAADGRYGMLALHVGIQVLVLGGVVAGVIALNRAGARRLEELADRLEG